MAFIENLDRSAVRRARLIRALGPFAFPKCSTELNSIHEYMYSMLSKITLNLVLERKLNVRNSIICNGI
jgi:hypothetical protein